MWKQLKSSISQLEDYIKGNNPTTASSCYILKENKAIPINFFLKKHRVGSYLQQQSWASDPDEELPPTTPAGSDVQPEEGWRPTRPLLLAFSVNEI